MTNIEKICILLVNLCNWVRWNVAQILQVYHHLHNIFSVLPFYETGSQGKPLSLVFFFFLSSHSALPQNLPHFHVRPCTESSAKDNIQKELYYFGCKSQSSEFPGYYSMSTLLKWACYPVVLLVGTRWHHTVDNFLQTSLPGYQIV